MAVLELRNGPLVLSAHEVQRLVLRLAQTRACMQPPLANVPTPPTTLPADAWDFAATPPGAPAELRIRVRGVGWAALPLPPAARAYLATALQGTDAGSAHLKLY